MDSDAIREDVDVQTDIVVVLIWLFSPYGT